VPRRLPIVALVALVVPASAVAATISVIPADEHFRRIAVFVAEPGETNDVDGANLWRGQPLTHSGAPLVAAEGCTSLDLNTVSCDAANYEMYLGDGDDHAGMSAPGWSKLWGGDGDDVLGASAMGQWGEAYGEAGDDVVSVGGEGGQLGDGGPGDDVVRVFGWGGQSTGIGGNGADFIEFRTTGVTSVRATLDGGNGNDTILAHPTLNGASTATGGPGNDTIVITSFFDPRIRGGGSYILSGGTGDDTLTGGWSIDTVDAGPGADTIDVTDGGPDTVTCGTGHDVVRYDPSDTVAADCEGLLN
jgi:Ca2+-binding RTX toxin-like protein